MRYITEFKVAADIPMERVEGIVRYDKEAHCMILGKMIAEVVGWEKREPYRHTLEVIAFSATDWIDFKLELKRFIISQKEMGNSTYNMEIVAKMIEDLEKIGGEKAQIYNNF